MIKKKAAVRYGIKERRKMLEGFLSLIDAFPAESVNGIKRDEQYRIQLQAELQELESGLNALAVVLKRSINTLRELRK